MNPRLIVIKIVIKTQLKHWWKPIGFGDPAQGKPSPPMPYLNPLRLLHLTPRQPIIAMRSQQLISLFAGLLTTTSYFLGTVTPAPACDRSLAQQQDHPTPVANVRIGMAETELVQKLGQPERRGREPVRCPTNRVHLQYAKSLVVLKPRQEATANPPTQATPSPAQTQNLVVVGITSADPAVVIAGGIHVGLAERSAIDKLTATCDRNSLAEEVISKGRLFNCTFAGEPVRIRIHHGQVSHISVGSTYPRDPEALQETSQ